MKKFGIQPRPPIKVPSVAPEPQPVVTSTETEVAATIPEIEPVVTTTETEVVVTTHECPTCSKLFAILNSSLKPPM